MGKTTHQYITELATVYKQSPLGFWTPREAGWVLYREDSLMAAERVRKKLASRDDNKEKDNVILCEMPLNGSNRILIPTRELERFMRHKYSSYKLNEKAYMQGVEVKVRYKVNIEE